MGTDRCSVRQGERVEGEDIKRRRAKTALRMANVVDGSDREGALVSDTQAPGI